MTNRAARLTMRGYQRHKRGDLRGALELYAQVIRQYPRYPDALHHAALAARQIAHHARAKGMETEALTDASSRLMLQAVNAATQIAQVAYEQDPEGFAKPGGAYEPMRKLYAAMLFNYAWLQQDRGRITGEDGAARLYATALGMDKGLGEGWTNLGIALGEVGWMDFTEAMWNRALDLPAVTPEARFNLSFLKIRRGDYTGGWSMYESRWDSPVFLVSYARPELTKPRWDGQPFDGTLYLHGEQGAGDCIMMARYIPLCQEKCTRVVVEVMASLVPLFRAWFPGLEVVTLGETPVEHDVQAPMMSMPALFGTKPDTVPPIPAFPGENLPYADGIARFGLCWKGSSRHPNDRNRSIPLEAFASLLRCPVEWQSLQFGEETEPPLIPLKAENFLDTARAIARCMAVITCDTAVAHLSASLGVPTTLLLPYLAEFRWGEKELTSPWYPKWLQILRQDEPGDWSGPIDSVKYAMASWLTDMRSAGVLMLP